MKYALVISKDVFMLEVLIRSVTVISLNGINKIVYHNT